MSELFFSAITSVARIFVYPTFAVGILVVIALLLIAAMWAVYTILRKVNELILVGEYCLHRTEFKHWLQEPQAGSCCGCGTPITGEIREFCDDCIDGYRGEDQ